MDRVRWKRMRLKTAEIPFFLQIMKENLNHLVADLRGKKIHKNKLYVFIF